jgi:EmrB/QacA subfamily drug resistance transporter
MASETPLQHRWLALTALAVGVSMIIVDATIVNVALPTIIDDLGIHLAQAEWITTIYILVFASLLITSGRVGDLTGRRRLFRIGLIAFVGASMLAGLAKSGGWLIGARFIQGMGASMTLPSALSIVNATFRGRDRGIAFGVWGSVIGGMAAIGPLLGGWVTSSYSWRWAFYINVPIGVLVWIGVSLWVKESRDEHAIHGFDIPGVLLIGTGLATFVFFLIEGPRYGWWIPVHTFSIAGINWPLASLSPVPFAGVISVVTLFAFAFRSLQRYTDRSLVDPALFKLRAFRYGNIVAAARSFGEFGLIFVLPLFLAGVIGYDAFHIGLALVPLAAGAFIGGPLAAYLAERFGPGRAVTFGMFLEGLSVIIASLQLRPGITGFHLAPALFIYGIGIGIAAAQLTNVILAEVPKEKSGQASGIQSTSRQIGSALGIALLGSILAISLGTLATKGLATIPGLPQEHQTTIVSAFRESGGQVLSQLRDQPQASAIVPVLDDALSQSARRAGLAGATIIGIGFLMSWMLPDTRTEEQKEKRSRKRRTSPAGD